MRTPSEISVKGLWWMHLLPKTDIDQKFYENFKTLQSKCGHSPKIDGLILMNKPEQRKIKPKIHRWL